MRRQRPRNSNYLISWMLHDYPSSFDSQEQADAISPVLTAYAEFVIGMCLRGDDAECVEFLDDSALLFLALGFPWRR